MKIIRSKRRTLALQINKYGDLIIRAPLRMPLDLIHKFVNEKESWILKHQQSVQERLSRKKEKQFLHGEEFFYLGKKYKLNIIDSLHPLFAFGDDGFFVSESNVPKAKQLFIRWYKKQAELKITGRVEQYSKILGIDYKKIKITSGRNRWGSCSGEGNLSFSWRLVMAPLHIIDYVVLHELTHIKERNHSKRFWNKLNKAFPYSKEA